MSQYHQSPWRNTAPSGRGGWNQNSSTRPPFSRGQRADHTASTRSNVKFTPRDIMEGLDNTIVKTFTVPKYDRDCDQEDIKIQQLAYIGSYNWVNAPLNQPTVIVPGSPPHWQNRSLPYTIPPDMGMHFVDQNGYRMGRTVLLPLISAVNKVQESKSAEPFDWASVDFVTDRNGLRALSRWVSGNSNRNFRIDLQLAGNKTVLMNRWSELYQEPFSGRTYGFSFEKASTTPGPGCKSSTGHHRIVTYDLNGLKMVVRFEVDACLPPPAKYPRKSISSIDELANSIGSMSLSQSSSPPSYNLSPLTILDGGIQISHASVIELTTRSKTSITNYGFDWKEAYPQLFFSQTGHHYLGIHHRGHFTEVQKRKLISDELQAVEQEAQKDLKKVHATLKLIKELVVAHGKTGRLTLVCRNGELSVYSRRSNESCLPDSVMELFNSPSPPEELGDGKETSEDHASPSHGDDVIQTIRVPPKSNKTYKLRENIALNDVKHIGSYNWIKSPPDEPAIIVPGKSSSTTTLIISLNFFEAILLDEHTLRLPAAPFLPLIVAVNQTQEDRCSSSFDWSSVDFIVSRNVLRTLTRWTRCRPRDSFRIDVDLVGEKTVLLNRWSGQDSEGEFVGNTFGINFEKESTTAGEECDNATGNNKMVTHPKLDKNMNGLKMVVRFESNACLERNQPLNEDGSDAIEDLASRLEHVDLKQVSSVVEMKGPLKVIHCGQFSVDDSIEITTRSVNNLTRNGFDWREAYPQLFLSQTKHHYLAIHEKGHFMKTEKRTLESYEFKRVEKDVQGDLKRLHEILLTIQELMRNKANGTKLSLVCIKGSPNNLRVYSRASLEECLPDFAMRHFTE
ncbi:hypothetical protein CVT24_001180 [Panaeolus cyanescens]|uniref:Uncharacterized protein n=1 Tax=Panaeolus cyanescens TaxID=181874 RepID=A0A409W2Y7_9AGAR|nr:hypothetical protein CVT24_001180 [Panaeolus cyanescens]